MTNDDVKRAFMDGKPARTANLVSTGEALLSYGYWEVARRHEGRVVVRKGGSYSMTTAHHRSGVVGELAKEETPPRQAAMRL